MRLAARKFAAFIWIGAAIIAVSFWMDWVDMPVTDPRVPGGTPGAAEWFVNGTFLALRYSWQLVVLGAVIWLLGDIRDRLAPSE